MFNKNKSDNSTNFWISYADLMAGLLFVFILLIGAIISKSIILKSHLHEKEEKLTKVSLNLKAKEVTLGKVQKNIAEKKEQILEKDKTIKMTKETLTETKETLHETKETLNETKETLDETKETLNETKATLTLKRKEIDKLNKMLLTANTQQDLLNNKIVLVQNMLADTNKSMNLKNETLQEELKEYEGKVIILSDQLTGVNNSVKSKDEKLLKLLNALDEKQTKYDGLIVKLQDQKAKIKSLTGIKLKVVAALKEALGDNVAIDRKSGSLRIASNILFDKGSAELKEGAKIELTKVFEEYIGTLVTNPKIKPHLDKIIIEGHTDSDGEYLYNLDLSQKRAFAVMNYLLTSAFAQEHHIKPLMIASGRAYLDAITLDGVEDKEASRRIEIKFRLKNEDAMQEIEKVLDAE